MTDPTRITRGKGVTQPVKLDEVDKIEQRRAEKKAPADQVSSAKGEPARGLKNDPAGEPLASEYIPSPVQDSVQRGDDGSYFPPTDANMADLLREMFILGFKVDMQNMNIDTLLQKATIDNLSAEWTAYAQKSYQSLMKQAEAEKWGSIQGAITGGASFIGLAGGIGGMVKYGAQQTTLEAGKATSIAELGDINQASIGGDPELVRALGAEGPGAIDDALAEGRPLGERESRALRRLRDRTAELDAQKEAGTISEADYSTQLDAESRIAASELQPVEAKRSKIQAEIDKYSEQIKALDRKRQEFTNMMQLVGSMGQLAGVIGATKKFALSMDAATAKRLEIAANKLKELQNMNAQQAQQMWSTVLEDVNRLLSTYTDLIGRLESVKQRG